MLKEYYEEVFCNICVGVLILVLVEHAQREHVFVRPYVLTCYVVNFTLINVFVLIKCICFYAEESAKITNLSDIGKVRSDNLMPFCFVEVQHFKEPKTAGEALRQDGWVFIHNL